MIDPDRFDPAAYVAAAAPAMGLQFSPERAQAVSEALALVVRVAAPALNRTVPAQAASASVFAP